MATWFVLLFINYNAYGQNNIQPMLSDSIFSSDSVEIKPVFGARGNQAGTDKLVYTYIKANIKYPARAIEDEFQGIVIARFYIDIDGTAKEPKIIRDDGCSDCAKEVIRAVKVFPKWIPGYNKGEAVKVYYTLPVKFEYNFGVKVDLDNKPAKFQGGEEYLNEFINSASSSIKITTKLVKEKKGKYFADVEFNVLEDGSVSNSKIISSNISDKTAIERILDTINKMPKWYPEIKNGQPLVTTQKISLQF